MNGLYVNPTLFELEEISKKQDLSSTFVPNLSLPIHNWFRFSAGFSALWVREVIEKEKRNGRYNLFDPFAGSGTTVLEGELSEINAKGIEAHPFIYRVGKAKLLWRENPNEFKEYALNILNIAKRAQADISRYNDLIKKIYTQDSIEKLDTLRRAWLSNNTHEKFNELTWLALAIILRECSFAGTAQWQYVLPNKRKAKKIDPYLAFEIKIRGMVNDMKHRQSLNAGPVAEIFWDDARTNSSILDNWADLVVTSPPYANNYDYADAMRLEMSFFGDINGWGDLQDKVRKYLVRSCTQHVASDNGFEKMINETSLGPVRRELLDIYTKLNEEKDKHGGKKPYHKMIAAYFYDLSKAWQSLRRVTRKGGLVCFVVGDSAPYGIYVPVEEWLGKLAVSAGFSSYSFEKTRDRNIKWKNRKHRVPLKEGRLWVKG